MKNYSLCRLNCNCSLRMKTRGKLVRFYGKLKVVFCPNSNCDKVYFIKEKA